MDPDAKALVDDPWVCPNDRELGLRAKLDTGWSYYTNRQKAGKKLLVKQEEISTIEDIIKKAEELTLREEYRIGRLVDRLENIKNNAQGNGITSCLLCDEKFGKISAAPIKCSICEKAACGKCGVDTMSSENVPIFLCKLCNEQREFWKKSGAWFFRQLPKHELPPARERHYLTSGSFIVSTPEMEEKKENLLSQASELYSDSDVESELSCEEILEGHPYRRSRKRQMTGRSKERKKAIDNIQEKNHYGDQMDGRVRHRPDMSGENRLSVTALDDASQPRSETPSPSVSREISDDESEFKNLSHANSPLLFPRKKHASSRSINSRESDDNSLSDQNINQLSRGESNEDDKIDANSAKDELKGPLGVIEFTVNFIKDVRRLDVKIHNAKGVKAPDKSGFPDLYVNVNILPGTSKGSEARTRTLQKTLNPIFNETITFTGISENDMKNKTLRLQVLDGKFGRNIFIGETTLSLKSILLTNNKKMQKILEEKSEISDGPYGSIYVSLCYVSKDNRLVVGIIRCSNLAPMDMNGFSDPYVKCYLLPDASKKTKRRTKVKKRNLNPEFNEQFSYNVPHDELASHTLEVTVWDHDVGKSNDFIGGIHLGVNSKDSLLKQWFETLKYPNKESKYWHILTRDITLHEVDSQY